MSSSYYLTDDRPSSFYTSPSHYHRYIPDTQYAIAALVGLWLLFTVLELLGLPVRSWLYVITNMALELASRFPPVIPRRLSDADEDGMQKTGGGVLSGVFGLKNGLMGSVRGVTSALSGGYKNVPAGLGNWDNSCYQNSVMQGLASLPSLRDYLARTTSENPAFDSDTTNGALLELINKLNDPENHGQQFWIKGKLKNMSTWQQQDAQEYFSKVLDELDEEVKKAAASRRRSQSGTESMMDLDEKDNASGTVSMETPTGDGASQRTGASEQPQVMLNPLDGLLAQRVGCTTCGFTEGLSLVPFNCITVPLGRGWAHDIRECLNEYTGLEYIEGVECPKCTVLKREGVLKNVVAANPVFAPQLQAVQDLLDDEDFEDKSMIKRLGLTKKVWSKSTKSRQAVIARAPKSLVLHVNRSIFDEMTGAQLKNTADVMYPPVLDLGRWCLGSQPSDSQKPDVSVEEAWPRDPRKSMLANEDPDAMEPSPFQYALKAVVTHYGNHGNGHYVCYRQHPFKVPTKKAGEGEDGTEGMEEPENVEESDDEQWWRLSDESVYESSAEEASRQGNVFMLFYERIDPEAARLPASSSLQAPEASTNDIPLPVGVMQPLSANAFDETAADVPLPDDPTDIDAVPLSPTPSPLQLPQLDGDTNITTPTEIKLTEASRPQDVSAYPTPPPETPPGHSESDKGTEKEVLGPETTSYDSDGAAQTTSDDEADFGDASLKENEEPKERKASTGPQKMRTAGNVMRSRGKSLPMVTAT